jgi:hypothetical protein
MCVGQIQIEGAPLGPFGSDLDVWLFYQPSQMAMDVCSGQIVEGLVNHRLI